MKSIIQEASTLTKAIEQGWIKAGKPQLFSVKIMQEPNKNFIGITTKNAKVVIFFGRLDTLQQTPQLQQQTIQQKQPSSTQPQQQQQQQTNVKQGQQHGGQKDITRRQLDRHHYQNRRPRRHFQKNRSNQPQQQSQQQRQPQAPSQPSSNNPGPKSSS
jgi:hypothetical protein